jgi:hypothetical protein
MRIGGIRPALAFAACAALSIGVTACAPAAGQAAARPATIKPAAIKPASTTPARIPRTVSAVQRTAFAATVTVHTGGPVIGRVTNRYIGLSFESGTLNSGKYDNVGDVAQLLRNLGRSVMRFGGNTVDTEYYGINASALAGLARLAKASGWTVLFSEDLAHFNAAEVTRDAHAVSAALGKRLSALACGNEPDLFPNTGLRPRPYTEDEYQAQVAPCLAAIRKGAPTAPIEGPDTSGYGWLPGYGALEAGKLSALGQHYYPMGCGLGGRTPATFAAAMLSAGQAAKEATFFATAAKAAAIARAPLRISETNTACNGGAPGVSNTYASALWAVDYLFTGLEHGVSGFNFHGGLGGDCWGYTPLCQVGWNEYAAQPIYYGLLLARLLGTGKLLPDSVATPSAADHVTAFALRPPYGDGSRLIVEDLTDAPADVTLQVGRDPSKAAVWHLTGPSLLATDGVRIQGAAVRGNGTFTPGRPATVRCSGGRCRLTLAPYSAAVVAVS